MWLLVTDWLGTLASNSKTHRPTSKPPMSNRGNRGEHGQGQDWIGYPAGCLQFFCIRIGFGYSFLKKNGSGQVQDICLISIPKFFWECFKMSHMMVLLFSWLWFLYSQKIKMILSVCAAQSMMIIRVTSS